MSLVIGVTGGIGSGKTTATDRFQQLGITVVDADQAARVVVEPGQPALSAIAAHFGTGILQADGSLDRAALRRLVFSDPKHRQRLEQLTHPPINEEIQRQLGDSTSAYTVLSSPLLLETSQGKLCDEVILIDAPESAQLARAMARDHNDKAQIQRIMAAQMPRRDRQARADHLVDNSGSIEQLHLAIDKLHAQFLRRSTNQAPE